MPKFLILRFSSIGDLVLTSPVVRCLKQQVQGAEVHFCTKKAFSALIDRNPYIDKRFYLEDSLSTLTDQLKRENYDFIIDLHHNLRTFIIRQRLGVKSYAFNKINFEKWLLVNFKIDKLPHVHIVDRYMATISSFGVKNDDKGLDFFLSEEDEQAIDVLPGIYKDGYVGFVIGARHATKRLPFEKLIGLCKNLEKPVVLLGGKEDFETGERIAAAVNQAMAAGKQESVNIFNACGKFSVTQSAAIVKHASKIITHDTGLMHIAAAFQKEIISIWGNTIPDFGMAPYYGDRAGNKSTVLEVKNLSCRPCSKIGFEKCPKKHFRCMNDINLDLAIQLVNGKNSS